MLNSMKKAAVEVANKADELQAKDKNLSRIEAVQQAMDFVKKKALVTEDNVEQVVSELEKDGKVERI